jgi:hypothetical protein
MLPLRSIVFAYVLVAVEVCGQSICSGPLSPIVAREASGQERMAGFAHPGQEGGPGRVIAPRQRRSGELVRAADIPPIRRDPPDELQTRGGL